MYVVRALAVLFLAQALLAQQPTPILPDPKLTPGDTFDVTAQDVCVPAKKVRAVPAWLKAATAISASSKPCRRSEQASQPIEILAPQGISERANSRELITASHDYRLTPPTLVRTKIESCQRGCNRLHVLCHGKNAEMLAPDTLPR